METVKDSFGIHGGQLFAILNVLQLAGWTAIMIYDGALAAQGIFQAGQWIWCLLIGVLIIVWILIGITNLGKFQYSRNGCPLYSDTYFSKSNFL